MQLARRSVGALAVVVAAALVPGAPAAVGSESGGSHRATASCVDEGGAASVRTP
jgi:hypothetical protein